MISTGKLVVLFRVAAAAATAAALLFLATVPANAQEPPPPPTPKTADADGDKIFDDLEDIISPANLDQTFPTVVLLEQPLTTDNINGLQSGIGEFDLEFEFESVDGFAANLTKSQILALSQLDQVVQIEADRPVKLFLDTSTLWFGVQKARTDFGVDGNADGASTYSKDDIVIAVLDTGIDAAHVDLNGGKVVAWADFTSGGCGSPCDPHGHGTHVSSIATGEGEGNALYQGVAPGAALVGVRVLNQFGSGSISGVNAGLQWVIDNKNTYNIRIINMSLGTSGCSDGTDSMSLMVNNVVAAGIVAVVSAGNSGPASCTIASPAAAEDAITVAAMADVGEAGFSLAYFSSRGPTADDRIKPDIAAPGRYITAARGGTSNGYTSMSGTSMSSPFVAGVAALMLDADLTLTPSQVKSTLMSTAVDWGPTGTDNDYGAGWLDAYEAVRVAKGASGTNIAVPNHQYVSATLSVAGDSNTYIITVTDATKPIAITLVMSTWSSGGNVDFDMKLRDKDGGQVGISQTVKRQETIGISSPTNGPYTLKVYAYSGSSGGPYFFDISMGGSIDNDGQLLGTPTSVPWGEGRIDVFARASDNGLSHRWYARGRGWSAWEDLGGVLNSGPDVSSWGGGRLDVFALGTDNRLLHKWFVRGEGWSGWERLGAPQGLTLTSDPGAVSWGEGRIDVFARASDNAIWHRWFVRGKGWSDWESLGGVLNSGPDVSSWAGGRLNVFAAGTDNQLRHNWFVRGKGWSGWENLGAPSGLTLVSQSPPVSWGDGRIDVFAWASDERLWHKWYVRGKGWSGWENLGGVLNSAPDASSWAEGRLDVFALDRDNRLRHKWYVRGQGWFPQAPWQDLGSP